MIKVFTHRTLAEALGEQKTKQLTDDFKDYKSGRGLPITFGRDVPYDFTHNRKYLELQHIHFKKDGFALNLLQFRRTSDYVLVYCPGFFSQSTFLLIAIIKHWDFRKPNETAFTDKDTEFMANFEAIAERFREKF